MKGMFTKLYASWLKNQVAFVSWEIMMAYGNVYKIGDQTNNRKLHNK